MFGGNGACGTHCFMWVAARTVNGQKKSWRLASSSIAHAMLEIVWLACSAMPFCGGKSGTVFLYVMPFVLQWASICPWISSGALSTHKMAIFSLQKVSHTDWYWTKSCSASLHNFIKNSEMNRE